MLANRITSVLYSDSLAPVFLSLAAGNLGTLLRKLDILRGESLTEVCNEVNFPTS